MFFSIAEKKYFSRRYRCKHSGQTLFVVLFLLTLSATAQALPLDVEVRGVQDEEYTNIMATVKIALQQNKTGLSIRNIRRLHKAAPEEIARALAPFGYYSVEVKDEGSLTKDDKGWHALYEV
ncbi:MAG: hypothetical protein D3904_13210, partial [Candidatus Electrothrix sp. EH2]|nr:hypothetical protein [Candidatus Electrothrix sp. EH2]